MIERLWYRNEDGGAIEFSVYSDFHVNVSRDVDGLSDVANKISSESTFGQDGETYVSSSIEARDVDIIGHLRTVDTARQIELRRRLNHILNPKLRGTLIYECGDLRRQITCYCEAAPDYKAGRMPQFTVQLRCPSPFWQDESRDEVHVAEWEGLMEFDDANGLQLDADWRIGNRTAELIVEVTNAGDVDCGLTVVFVAEGAVTNPELMNAETLKAIKLNIEMVSGDRIEVTTAYGQKSAILTRSGELYNIFRCIDESTDFLQLEVGANLFVADAGTNASSLNTTILHSDLYLGV